MAGLIITSEFGKLLYIVNGERSLKRSRRAFNWLSYRNQSY